MMISLVWGWGGVEGALHGVVKENGRSTIQLSLFCGKAAREKFSQGWKTTDIPVRINATLPCGEEF